MDNWDYSAIGKRIKILRKKKGYTQQELADILGKSLRTVQKYETGEIEVSISVVNQLANELDTTPTFILGYDTEIEPLRSLADVMNYLFHIEQITGLQFSIEVKKPPKHNEWTCSLTFNGRDSVRTYEIKQHAYRDWKEKTLAYYTPTSVESVEPQEIDEDERIKKRIEYLNSLKP